MKLVVMVVTCILMSQVLAVVLLWRLRYRPAATLALTVLPSTAFFFCLIAAAYSWVWLRPAPAPPGEYRCGEILVVIAVFILGGAVLQLLIASVSVAAFVFVRSRHRAKAPEA